MEVPYGQFGFFASRGLSSFLNQNAILANLGIVRAHIGFKVGRIGPWPLMEVHYDQFGCSANRGPSLFGIVTLNWPFMGIIKGHR